MKEPRWKNDRKNFVTSFVNTYPGPQKEGPSEKNGQQQQEKDKLRFDQINLRPVTIFLPLHSVVS